ncbi:MAG: hypothetical protein HOH69_14020 [Gammaproteobacteria bacterium]|jgi:hypothetical protein|nr:hypothetical protein [Gammaproteobacteria bacterium]
MSTTPTLSDFIPWRAIPKKYPELFTFPQWKWMVIQRKNNGLAPAFRKVGKHIIVNEILLAECLNNQGD